MINDDELERLQEQAKEALKGVNQAELNEAIKQAQAAQEQFLQPMRDTLNAIQEQQLQSVRETLQNLNLPKLQEILDHAYESLNLATNLEELSERRSAILGKKGELTHLSRSLGTLPPEERAKTGKGFNITRQLLDQVSSNKEVELTQVARENELTADQIDVTLPGRQPSLGHLHPTTKMFRQIFDVFQDMGFQIWDSPEVETDEYNFELLNFLPNHPARDMQDTFYIETPPDSPRVVMRTHTSPGQIHAMRRYAPEPVRVLLPGKCYRNEQVTARSEMQFSQFEFLAVGRNISMADMKGTLSALAVRLFGAGTQVRLRPSYFPFTEPSAEMDVSCTLCKGAGCRMCKYSGWLEIGGCGMVHPVVLQNGGYDPAEFSGFAGGFGPERIANLKYGVDDIRWYYSGDDRFIQQLG